MVHAEVSLEGTSLIKETKVICHSYFCTMSFIFSDDMKWIINEVEWLD